ncbi:hypothetical protein D3C85_1650950 [compost metagenome]
MHRALEQLLNAPVVSELQKSAHHLNQMLPDALGVFRLAKPGADHLRRFVAANQRH